MVDSMMNMKVRFMDNKIIDKLLKFIEKDVTPMVKKDLKWLGKTIIQDLKKLTK